jgi:predicted hydrocarbon binding protein
MYFMSRRHIPWIIYAKDRDICEFHFSVPNKPGMLYKVLKLFRDHNINLLSGAISALPDDEYASAFFFTDITGVNSDMEEFKRMIERESGGKVYIKYPGIRGFMFGEFAFPLTALPGVRSIIFLERDIGEMIKGLYDKLSDLASVFLYHMAYSGGRFIGDYVYEKLHPKGGKKLITEAVKIYQSAGWGRVKIVSYEPEATTVIRLHDSFECGALEGSERPMSNFIRGHINGLISGILNKELSIIETKCISKGDEYCEFELKPR